MNSLCIMNEQEIEKLLKEAEEKEKILLERNKSKGNEQIKEIVKEEKYIPKENLTNSEREKFESNTFRKNIEILDSMKNEMSDLFCSDYDREAKRLRDQYYEETKRIKQELVENYLRIASPYQMQLEEMDRQIMNLWEQKKEATENKEIQTLKNLIIETEQLTEEGEKVHNELKSRTKRQEERLNEFKKYAKRREISEYETESVKRPTIDQKNVKIKEVIKKRKENPEGKNNNIWINIISLVLALILGFSSALIFLNWYILIPAFVLICLPPFFSLLLKLNLKKAREIPEDNQDVEKIKKAENFAKVYNQAMQVFIISSIIGIILGIILIQQFPFVLRYIN